MGQNNKTMNKTCSKLTINQKLTIKLTIKIMKLQNSGVFIVNLEQISDIVLKFPLM